MEKGGNKMPMLKGADIILFITDLLYSNSFPKPSNTGAFFKFLYPLFYFKANELTE